MRRRDFIRGGIASAGVLAFGPAFWSRALAGTPATPAAGPYGPLLAPDANGLRLPEGFKSRVVARGLIPVGTTGYVWHAASDGSASYALDDGGFILVSNSEVPGGMGGASSLRFDRDGNITDAYRILDGTDTNCAGGPTPWGTWLSCEEVDDGRVWECDPMGKKPAEVRPALGVFKHEAVCVDPVDKRLYLTEDIGDAGFYRFTPESYPNLDKGLLEIAVVGPDGVVAWKRIPKPLEPPIRAQVPEYTRFKRGEGIWFDSGTVYMATTSDDRIYTYNSVTEVLDVLYDGKKLGDDAPLHEVDNVTVAPGSGDIYVGEDADDLNLCLITPEREVAAFVQVTGPQHSESELTGPAFDPSGTRLYFSSQRGFGAGLIYEVSGPFRKSSRDVIAPEFRLEVPARIRRRTLRKRGLLVGVRCPEAAEIKVSLRMGRKTLARRSLKAEEPGVERVLLKLSRRGREALRGRRAKTLKVTVSAKDSAGNRRVLSKSVRLR